MSDGYIGLFQTPTAGYAVPQLDLTVGNIGFQVEETIAGGSEQTTSIAKISVSDVTIQNSGAQISAIAIEHSLNDSDWEAAGMYDVKWDHTGSDYTKAINIPGMSYRLGPAVSGIQHFFRGYFINPGGSLAIDSASTTIGPGGTYMTDNDYFNGLPDTAELMEVTRLSATNGSNPEGGSWAVPAVIPGNGIIRMEWDDMKTHRCYAGNGTCSNSHPTGDGSTEADLPDNFWQKITTYDVYIYVGQSAAPAVEYPDPSEANGAWYKVGETKNNYMEMDLPDGKKVSFWVGCKIKNYTPSITVSGFHYPNYVD
ncbi:MAG: hypothetical protein ACW98F_00035 [Candidatus Hodarchaeales archaeon]|jgi:hypothetical protein